MKAFGNNTAETHKDEKKMNLSWENFCTTCVHVKENDAQLISLSLRWHYSFLQNYFSHHKRKQSGYKCCKDYTASRFTAISIPRVLVKYMLKMLFWISRQFFPRVQLCWKSKQTVKKLKFCKETFCQIEIIFKYTVVGIFLWIMTQEIRPRPLLSHGPWH